MANFDERSEWGALARVLFVENRRYVYAQLADGRTAWFDFQDEDQDDFEPGDVVLILNDHIEPAPEAVWKEEPWVSVVRVRNEITTVVEYAGHVRILPTSDIPYEVGNTVKVLSSKG